MVRNVMGSLVLFVVLSFWAAPGLAADANFQGNCDPADPNYCEFDANRTPSGQVATSCGFSAPVRYQWRFGDGGSAVTFVPFVDHVYVPGPILTDHLDVCMSVECADGTSAFQCHCLDFTGQANLPDCIQPGGWTPR